jgi:hypothetical protein
METSVRRPAVVAGLGPFRQVLVQYSGVPSSCFHIHNLLLVQSSHNFTLYSLRHCRRRWTYHNQTWSLFKWNPFRDCSGRRDTDRNNSDHGRLGGYHIGVPANGSPPQKLPGSCSEWFHHSDLTEHANGFHLNNPRKLHTTSFGASIYHDLILAPEPVIANNDDIFFRFLFIHERQSLRMKLCCW